MSIKELSNLYLCENWHIILLVNIFVIMFKELAHWKITWKQINKFQGMIM